MLYSIIPPEVVLDDSVSKPGGGAVTAAALEFPIGPGPDRVLVRDEPGVGGVVQRLISTDPRRYLDEGLAPGAPWRRPRP